MKVALVCIAKDEDHYLREWLDWHFNIGFDTAYVYCNDWQPHMAVPPNTNIIYWPGKVQQLNAYNDFLAKYSKDFDWAAFIDVDEFICTGKFDDIKSMLNDYKDYFALGLNWKLFGTSGYDKADYTVPVVDRFTHSQMGFNEHIKTLLNLKNIRNQFLQNDVHFINPHFVAIAVRSYFTIRADKREFVHGPFTQFKEQAPAGMPYIAHYVTKSKEEFYIRRSKIRADTASPRENIDEFF